MLERLDNRLYLTTFAVNTTLDLEDLVDDGIVDVDPDTPGEQLSFREAIKQANADPDADVIQFEVPSGDALSVESPLPAITQPVTIDAAGQLGDAPIVLTTTAKDEGFDGLVVQTDGVVIHGLRIEGFGGNGVFGDATADALLVLNEVEIRGNGGFGVLHNGNLRMNRGTDALSESPLSMVRENGQGGIQVLGNFQADRPIVVDANQGAGILAQKDVDVFAGVTSSNNAGPGIQSLQGSITINRGSAPDDAPVVVVSNNAGPGILAGDEIFADATARPVSAESRPRDVTITTSAVIENNAGWGVMAPRGDVLINMVAVFSGGTSQLRSRISGNGNPEFTSVSFVNDELQLITPAETLYEERGGVFAAGSASFARATVSGNAGAGVLGNLFARLIEPVVEDNLGTGIQVANGDVEIISPRQGFDAVIARNAGPGVVAAARGPTLTDLFASSSRTRGDISIIGPATVSDNAGWGLLAHRDVLLSLFDSEDTRASVFSNNGDSTRPIFTYLPLDGEPVEVEHFPDAGGGIAAGRSITNATAIGAFRPVVTDNQGPGIVAGLDVDLIVPTITDNEGPGVSALDGSVHVLPSLKLPNPQSVFARNQGSGISAGEDIVFLMGNVEASDNAYWGFEAEGRLLRGENSTAGQVVATKNGNPNAGQAFTVTVDGDVRTLSAGERNNSGGMLALEDVDMIDVASTNNFGDGLAAEGDVQVERGQFCFNTNEQVVAGGTLDLIDGSNCETIVRNTLDSGFGSLRNAVMTGGEVTFDMDALGPGPHTITLESEIIVEQSVFVVGPGSDVVTVSGNNTSRLFSLADPDGNELTASFSDLTLRDGNAQGDEGGAIRTENTFLSLNDVVLQGNQAGRGGAVAMLASDNSGGYGGGGGSAELIVEDSLFTDNSADDGGAIWAQTPLDVQDTLLQNNTANFNGGAVYLESSQLIFITFRRDTFFNNQAIHGDGGAIWLSTDADNLTDVSTFSGNSAGGNGGAVYHQDFSGQTRYIHVTMTDNRADADGDGGGRGGAIANDGFSSVDAEFSILAGNFAGTGAQSDDVAGLSFSNGNLIGVDPRLAPLADNGGATPTHALLEDSPAIDAALDSFVLQDQRGLRRHFEADAGAYERVFDFGDALPQFPVLRDDGGAAHLVGGLTLGPRIDSETDGRPSANADGDDSEFTDDEDGVEIRPAASTFSARTFVTSSGDGFLNAWVDFNGNNSWDDAGEQIFVDVPVTAGVNDVDFEVPDIAALLGVDELEEPLVTYARFRLSTQPGLTPRGVAPDGEVEDRQVEISEAVISVNQVFRDSVTSRVPRIYDPEVAVGYVYDVSSGPGFATLEMLPGFGDDVFTLAVDNGDGAFTEVLTFEAGEQIDFETDPRLQFDGGVHRFRITGIEMDAAIDPDDPLGFPTVLSFVDDGEVVFSQIPLVSPTAAEDSATTDEETPVVISAATGLLSNDTDPDEGDVLRVSAVGGDATAVGRAISLPSGAVLQVESDGSYVYDPSEAFQHLGVGETATDSFIYQVSDLFGGTDENSAIITITGVNDAPTVSIVDLPSDSIEGSPVSVNAVVTDPDANDTHNVQWSVTKDGASFATGTGTLIEFTPDDDGQFLISVLATDSANATGDVEVALTIGNQAPTADLQVPDRVVVGEPATFSLVATDVGVVDQGSDFTFQIDWNADGVVDETVVGPSGTPVARSFENAGETSIGVTATDKDGAVSQATVVTISVAPDGNEPGTAVLVAGDLIVTGTDGDDSIRVHRDGRNGDRVRVYINRDFVGAFAPAGDIRIAAGTGDDKVRIDRRVTIDALLDGGDGNDLLSGGGGRDSLQGGDGNDQLWAGRQGDHLEGGPGNDMLFAGMGSDTLLGGDGNDRLFGRRGADRLEGGAGNDFIRGGSDGDWIAGGPGDDNLQGGSGDDVIRGGDGNDRIRGGGGQDILVGGDGNDRIEALGGRDLLIGGLGSDDLRGGRGQDIVLSGATSFDDNDEALRAILEEWTSNRDFDVRVQNIQQGQGALAGLDARLNANSLEDDDAVDALFGDREQDLYFANHQGGGVLDSFRNHSRRGEDRDTVVDID